MSIQQNSGLVRAGLALLACLVPFAAAALDLRIVAQTGDTAPGTGGASYLGFGPVVANDLGDAAFTATLEPVGAVDASNDLGLWSEPAGVLTLVERQGDSAAGVAGTWDVALAPPAWNDAGQVAFHGSTDAPNAVGIWTQGSGALAPVAVSGEAADGLPAGVVYAGPISLPAWSDTGRVAFHGGLAGTGITSANDRAVWSGSASAALSLVAREGEAAPDSGGAAFVGFEGTLVDDAGGVAFRASLDDGGSGLYAGPASNLRAVARDGSPAPGLPGASFANFIRPELAPNGEVAFHAGLAVGAGGVTSDDDRGLWVGSPATSGYQLREVAREGDVAPGGSAEFSSFGRPRLNASGEVFFRAFFDGGTGLFLERGGVLAAVARTGDTAPGTDLGLGPASFAGFSEWALAPSGQLAFLATLDGSSPGVTGSNDGTLWYVDHTGALELVAREGDLVELAPGDLAVVEALDFFGESAAFGRGLASHGFIAYVAGFSDGREAVFLPEPGAWAGVAALAFAGALARRRSARKR